MDRWEWVATFSMVGGLGLAGYLAGLLPARYRSVRSFVFASIVGGYLLLTLVTAWWTAACPGCRSHSSYDGARWQDLFNAVFTGGVFALGILALVWVGALTRRLLSLLTSSLARR